jgi:outer membrane receptor protein involved in Fe transport
LNENILTYAAKFKKKHAVNALAGFTYQYQDWDQTGFSAINAPLATESYGILSLASGLATEPKFMSSRSQLFSFLGRVNYTYNDTYLFTLSGRSDGSSKFTPGKQWGYFPSGAFAWKMQDYEFIKDLKIFNTLKFRTSIGLTGNQDIANYLSITTFGKGGTTVLDGQQTVTLEPKRIANPDLKWETTEQINFGFDMGFVKNRILASFDYFQKNTTDMLFDLPIPSSNGFTSIMQNIGNIKNVGFEFTIDSKNLTGKFKWNTSLNLSTLKNTVTDMGSIPEINYQNAGVASLLALIRVGEPLNSFYGYKTNGIWQTQQEITSSGTLDPVKPGDVKYVDTNGDKVVNTSDRVVLGKSFPSFTMGLTNVRFYKKK